tara:strand:- start:1071 stop:1739 length:669 start_codon:yes stop_codon:yes gene_type:complete
MLGRTPEDKIEKQELFLKTFRDVGTIRKTCEIIGISESIVYKWRKDQAFQDEFKISRRSFGDLVENMALERVAQQSPNSSPLLLITLLNGNRPDKYNRKADAVDEDDNTTVNAMQDISRMMSEAYKEEELKAVVELQEVKKELEQTKLLLEEGKTSVIDNSGNVVKPTPKPRPFKTEAQLKQELEERTQEATQGSAPVKKPTSFKRKKSRLVDAPKIKVKRW